MESTKTLPDSFVYYDKFGKNQYRKAAQIYYVIAFVLAIPSYILFNWLAKVLRPDFASRIAFNPTFRLLNIAVMLIIVIVIFVIHEWIHVLFLWFFLGEQPKIILGLTNFHVEAPKWYLSRNHFLIVDLAPLCLLTLVGLLLLLMVPKTLLGIVVFGLTVNAAGSMADLASSIFISMFPATSYITTSGAIFIEKTYLMSPADEHASRWRGRPFLEQILSKLDT